jgi:hypothetical protein
MIVDMFAGCPDRSLPAIAVIIAKLDALFFGVEPMGLAVVPRTFPMVLRMSAVRLGKEATVMATETSMLPQMRTSGQFHSISGDWAQITMA